MVGGKIGKQEQVTSSATTLVSGKGRWSPAIAPLPVAVYGLRVVSLNNQIIAIGSYLIIWIFLRHFRFFLKAKGNDEVINEIDLIILKEARVTKET